MCSASARYAAWRSSETPEILSGRRLDAELGQVDGQVRGQRARLGRLVERGRRAAAARRSSRRRGWPAPSAGRRTSCTRGGRSRRRAARLQDFALRYLESRHSVPRRNASGWTTFELPRGEVSPSRIVSFALAGVERRPGVGRLVELAVELRRVRLAVLVLRLEELRLVGLVPDRPHAHAVAVAAADRGRERAELLRVRIGDVVALVARRPLRNRAGQRQRDRDAASLGGGDQPVEVVPLVRGIGVGVAGVEGRLGLAVRRRAR